MTPFVLAGFAAFLSLYSPQPILPLFERVFGASHFTSSLTVTATTIGVAIAAPVVGRVADVFGKRRVVVSASFLLAGLTLLTATSRSLPQIVVWRFAVGLVTPGVFAVAVAFIHDRWTGHRAAQVTAAYVSGTVLGGFSGRLLSGQAAAVWGWRASFAGVGALGLVCAVVLALSLPADRGAHVAHVAHTADPAHLMARLTTRPLVGTYLAGFFLLFSQVAMFTYVTFHLAAPPYLLTTAALGWLFAVYLAGAMVTPTSATWITRYGHRATLGIAMAIGVAGSILTLGRPLPVIVLGLVLVCSAIFIAQTAANGHIGVAAQSDRGLAVGLYATSYYIGGSAGGAVPSMFWASGGWTACVVLTIAVQIIAAAIGWMSWLGRG
ncbi:MAG TPA: MFS transporter [Vicinamibacterales bacterium]|nr:MFS transporter [Vicinamibacterales bacterium]